MSDTKGLYDDLSFLEMVKAEFKGRYPTAALRLTQPLHPDHKTAACLWRGFKEGVEFAIEEELRHLYSALEED